MKSYELQPTYENLITTYLHNTIDRNVDIYRFVSILNVVEDNCSIALDGKWGSGKTFFVKQVKMVMDTFNNYIESPYKGDFDKIKSCWNQYKLKGEEIFEPQSQVSVYYDSWANDNDEDPILSLIYEILQSVKSDYSFKSGLDCLKIAESIAEFFTGKKINALIDAFKRDDPFSALKASKDIHSLVDEFFESLLVEQGNRLVIFIDELDRCKPSYAVQLLERIKHYFTNDRISFVFSINIEELQHTIKRYYGSNFNSCKYLDRFFDLHISLPPANMQKFYQSINFNSSYYTYDKISHIVIETYHFELREIAKYLRMTKIAAHEATRGNKYSFAFSDGKAIQFCLLCIVPIMIGLKIENATRYKDFVQGKDSYPLIEILGSGVVGRSMCQSLLQNNETYEENEQNKNVVHLDDKLKAVYDALFVENYQNRIYGLNIGQLSFDKNTRSVLLRVVSLISEFTDFTS